ncbi:MAG TPA: hypothetical protein VFQ53_03820 [Kofleriaceae bacterium]|nr:hypothetical protein [Kofleriaceae bacterium]
MTSRAARMLEQCVASPDDDEPRLVWADAIGGERGELVVLQCDLARGGLAPREVAVRRRRERELLARHGAGWSGLAGLATRWNFHRGFVESVRVELGAFARDPGAVLAAVPLATGIAITDLCAARRAPEALGLLGSVFAHPAFRRVRALEIVEPVDLDPASGRVVPLADDVAALLAAYGVGHVTALGITGGSLGERGMEALGALAEHATLSRLWLRDQALRTDDVRVLLRRFPDLTTLELGRDRLELGELEVLLDRPLRSLTLGKQHTEGFARLAASTAATTLEHLALLDFDASGPLTDIRFPALHSLELTLAGPSDRFVEQLASFELPALRELAIAPHASARTLSQIAERFGRQLDVLDVRSCDTTWQGTIAGELLVEDVTPPRLPHPTAPPRLATSSR